MPFILTELPPDIAHLVLENAADCRTCGTAEAMRNLAMDSNKTLVAQLMGAFIWSETPEGQRFWSDLCDVLEQLDDAHKALSEFGDTYDIPPYEGNWDEGALN